MCEERKKREWRGQLDEAAKRKQISKTAHGVNNYNFLIKKKS